MNQLQLSLPESPASGGEFLTIAEAARHVRCHERTIRRAIDSGALRAGRIRVGASGRGAWRIRRADLDAWMFDDGS